MGDNGVTIIKRKKVVAGGGHHGGAWKVAYADFVTAMMAFFLLMWLLNATTESQRKGIADYFAPTVPLSPVSGGGDGVLNGDSVFTTDTLAQDGLGGVRHKIATRDDSERVATEEGSQSNDAEENGGLRADADEAALSDLETRLLGMSGESDVADDLLSHIVTRVTDEGLVIDVFAKEGRPLFGSGSAAPTEKMSEILLMISGVIDLVSNEVAIDGHTDAEPFIAEDYDNWRLSSERADAARRALLAAGTTADRFARITGKAARELALVNAPTDPRNRRITITLLRSDR